MTAVATRAGEAGWPWWLVLLNGIAGVIIGILLLTSTAATVVIIVQFIGIYWLISGIFQIVSIFMDSTAWGWRLASGLLGVIAGIIIIQNPLWTAVIVPATLVLILGIQGIIMGILGIIQAFSGAGWGAGILGLLSLFLGFVLVGNAIDNTLVTTASLAIIAGIFAIIGGIAAIVMAFRMR